MTVNTGKSYEKFVQNLMQAILDSENQGGQKNIKVRQNEKIADRFGVERQFDVLWDYEQGGIAYKTIIECKDYNSPVSIDKIDALLGKLADFPSVRGIIATTKGYQSGAEKKALNNGIELLCIRKQNDSDWVDEDGNPLIKKIALNIIALQAPLIIQCNTFLDKKYIEDNNIDPKDVYFSDSLNIDVFIEDMIKKEKYSLYELQSKIANKDDTYGIHEKVLTFDDAYISNQKIKVKLKELHVKYRLNPPSTITHEINAEEYILGVIEYLNQGKKKTVFNHPYSGTMIKNNHSSSIKAGEK